MSSVICILVVRSYSTCFFYSVCRDNPLLCAGIHSADGACSSCGQLNHYSTGTLSLIRVTGTHFKIHYDDVIMTMLASQITSLTVVYSIVYSCVNQRKHQSSASLAFVREIHRGPVNFPHKWPVTRKMFPFDDVIMRSYTLIFHLRVPELHISRNNLRRIVA